MYNEHNLDETIRECAAAIIKALGVIYKDMAKAGYTTGGILYIDEIAEGLIERIRDGKTGKESP